jgi:hypothetical protein
VVSDLAPVVRRILVVIPSPMMARNFLHSGALALLGMRSDTLITVVSPNPDDRTVVVEAGATWAPYFHPRRWRGDVNQWWAAGILRWSRYLRYLAGLALHTLRLSRFFRSTSTVVAAAQDLLA